MQTFLPSPDFTESARVLDDRRLGKQRSEALTILRTLLGLCSQGWANHPAVRMWRGHEHHLKLYAIAVCEEWIRRGYNDTVLGKVYVIDTDDDGGPPPWFGDEEFHAAHRSNLLRKAPDHYRQFWPDEPDDLPYVWPVPDDVGGDDELPTWEADPEAPDVVVNNTSPAKTTRSRQPRGQRQDAGGAAFHFASRLIDDEILAQRMIDANLSYDAMARVGRELRRARGEDVDEE